MMEDAELLRLPIFDRVQTIERLDGDEELFKELMGIFQEDGARQLAELKQCVTSSNADSVSKVAHGIKGALGNIGAMRAHRVAFEIELCGKAGVCDAALVTRLESEIKAYLVEIKAS